MAGTKLGGKRAAQSNKERHGKNFYREIGAKGGRNGHSGGFKGNPELARRAGRIGGTISKRGPSKRRVPESMRVKSVVVPIQRPSRYERLVRSLRASGPGRKVS